MLKKAAFALITLVLVLVVAEGVARVLKREVSRATIPASEVTAHVDNGAMKYHPELGWVRAQLPLATEGLNAAGFRYGEDVSIEKPAGTWRAFALGDSQTYGAGVDYTEAYPMVAQARLRERHGDDVQLINAAISGYGSLQALRLLRLELLKYDPDVIIVDTETRDDPRDDQIRATAKASRVQELLFYSRAYYFLRVAVERSMGFAGRLDAQGQDEIRDGGPQSRRGNHDLIHELGRREGFDVVFVNYPVMAWQGGFQCLGHDKDLPAGAKVARVCEALKASGHAPHDLFFDANHMKPLGCQIAGEALADALDDLGVGP